MSFTLLILVFLSFFGLLPALLARKKGRSFFGWWVFGTLLFIVALPYVLFVRPKKDITAPSLLDTNVSGSVLLPSVGVLLAIGVAMSTWKSPRDQRYEDLHRSLAVEMCEHGRCAALGGARETELESAAKRRWLYFASGFLCVVGIVMYANDRYKRKHTRESHIPIEG